MKPPKPCLTAGCTRYAVPGGSRCAEHTAQDDADARRTGRRSPGTTAAWKKAREKALRRAGYRCEKCGRTKAQAEAAGTWLEVHHKEGRGVNRDRHDQAQLQVLCRTPCHVATLKQPRKPWPPARPPR